MDDGEDDYGVNEDDFGMNPLKQAIKASQNLGFDDDDDGDFD